MLDFAALFSDIPPELATLLIAMTPIGELRAALPIALTTFQLPFVSAFTWSVLGNLIPVVILLKFLEPVARWLSRWSTAWARFFHWLYARTRQRTAQSFRRWGAVALVLFVALPLPVTGAWTGAVAAFIFGVPFRYAFPLITAGVLIAGLVVTVLTYGVGALLS